MDTGYYSGFVRGLLSEEDSIALVELIHQSLSCGDEDGLRALLEDFKSLIPYRYTACLLGKLSPNGAIKSFDLVNISFPSEWLEQYLVKKYHCIDPIVKENFTNFSPQYWANTYRAYNTPKDFIAAAEAFGLKKGYSHGIRNRLGTGGSLFSFSGDSVEAGPRTEIILRHIVPHLHQALARVLTAEENAGTSFPSLTPKEKEVLKWLKQGKSTWDMSQILFVGQDTIKYHVKNIFRKLDVSNRAQAVAVAMELGLIGPE